jgi:hypothetical protein
MTNCRGKPIRFVIIGRFDGTNLATRLDRQFYTNLVGRLLYWPGHANCSARASANRAGAPLTVLPGPMLDRQNIAVDR